MRKPAKRHQRVKTLADRLIIEFKLERDKEFIRFHDGPSTLTNMLAKASQEMAAKYGSANVEAAPVELVHASSFARNPLRYIDQMIEQCNTTEAKKRLLKRKVHTIVKAAMRADPYTTVRDIINSMARVARF